ncbi:hypothetical protein [Prauserella flavalba]|uniref:Uncharacterized protein n=1 Tax=Prauserella flavalba TaxID=1477506 RepID=A0A318LLS9_9PSEU|nr:hypothetical protein [Prauserella flavalba]PXY17051.1 hypothetical protein BA062_37905 [Prauserella flavalba]
MTIRLYTAWSDATQERAGRSPIRDAAIRAALLHLLADNTAAIRRPPSDTPARRVALIGGFDRGSRAVRAAVKAAATGHGWPLLDLPTVPAFGAIPPADDIAVVVAANPAVSQAAHRCAAFWRCRVLDPAVDPADLACRERPAVAVTTADGLCDHSASRWEISGSLTYRTRTGPATGVTAIAVEPGTDGIVIDRVHGDRHERARLGTTSLVLRVDLPTEGTIDGHAQIFPAGTYTFVAQPERYGHLALPGEQG